MNLSNLDKVDLIESLLVINKGGPDQAVLLENGTVEMTKIIDEGIFETSYYAFDGEFEQGAHWCLGKTNLRSMLGDLSRVIDILEKI